MVSINNYQNSYSMFLVQEAYNQSSILHYSTECICLESGDFKGIQAVNESLLGGLKDVVNKIIETVISLFTKFNERMGEFFLSKNTFLEKYKDIILKKPVKERDIKMYKYDVDKIINGLNVPSLNITTSGNTINASDKILNLAGKDEGNLNTQVFINQYLPNAGIKFDADKTFEEMIKIALRGEEEVDMKTTTMPIKIVKMYDYCTKFKATQESYKKDADQIEKNKAAFESILSKISTTVKVDDPSKEGAKTEAVWSNVKMRYLTELEVDSKASDTSQAQNNTRVGDQGVNSNNKEGIQTAVQTKVTGAGNNEEDMKKTLSQFEEASKVFFTCSGNIVAAKISVASQMFKEFYQLIKIHVRDYVADASDASSEKK